MSAPWYAVRGITTPQGFHTLYQFVDPNTAIAHGLPSNLANANLGEMELDAVLGRFGLSASDAIATSMSRSTAPLRASTRVSREGMIGEMPTAIHPFEVTPVPGSPEQYQFVNPEAAIEAGLTPQQARGPIRIAGTPESPTSTRLRAAQIAETSESPMSVESRLAQAFSSPRLSELIRQRALTNLPEEVQQRMALLPPYLQVRVVETDPEYLYEFINPEAAINFGVLPGLARRRLTTMDLTALIDFMSDRLTQRLRAEFSPESPRDFRRFSGESPAGSPRRQLRFEEPPSEMDPIYVQSLETLMKQLYGQPVTLPQFLIVNQLRVPFISFEEADRMLRAGEIRNYLMEPLVQPWAGPPTGPNRIITLIAKDGRSYLVKGIVNGGEIFPPV